MAKQFEFRLIDGTAPAGQLEADDLIVLVQSLKEVATKLGRNETDAESVGRPAKRTQRLATLNVGMAPGSTRVLLQRTAGGEDALDFDLEEERSFDEHFEDVIGSIAADERPEWVSSSLAIAVGKLRAALESAAPKVEFRAGGQVTAAFMTAQTHGETWVPVEPEPKEPSISFVGRLRAVNLDTHRLQVTDDVGNKVGLPEVANDMDTGRLLGSYVEVVGSPARDTRGRLTHIYGAVIHAAAQLPDGIRVGPRTAIELDEILVAAPGPSPEGIHGLTEDEADSFFEAIGA